MPRSRSRKTARGTACSGYPPRTSRRGSATSSAGRWSWPARTSGSPAWSVSTRRSRRCASRSRRTAGSTSPRTRRRSGPASTRSTISPSRHGSRNRHGHDDDQEPRHDHDRRRHLQGLRAVHHCMPASCVVDDGGGQPPRLPLPAAASRLHRLRRLPHGVSRLLLRGVPFRRARDDRRRRGVVVTAVATADRRLMEGSEAMAEAVIAAGCRFFAGYPMTPFTELLEHLAKKLPEVGGVCINAESELEAVGMAWGALATGARAATGSTGQGLSLMQESFSEITLAELPLVVFNMARGQQDYFQSTRGGGHGDYRHLVLAPLDIAEAVQLTQLAFHLADKWRNPVLVYGDYLLAHTHEAVSVEPVEFPPLPSKAWAVDGSGGGTGDSRLVTPLGLAKHGPEAPGIERHLRGITAKHADMERQEQRAETAFCD